MSMNVVNSGNTYQIYGDALKTYKQLPLGTYEVCFHKMMGFSLSLRDDLEVNEEKIYGSTPEKVEKVLRGFEASNRNFGVILSGKKGIGKSLFARQLAVRAKENDLPLILVNSYTPGIADFIASIEQEVIVFFDEFEKTFGEIEQVDPQEEMLSLFDGIDNGKKLFIITCNEVNKLNSYLLNRPGRFHYHFILGNPNADEIAEYMKDKLKPEYHNLIDKIITFSMNVDLTYDVLRAIAFELNRGYGFEETLMDLNISKEGIPKYNMRFEYEDGYYRFVRSQNLNIYSKDRVHFWINGEGRNDLAVRYGFLPSDVHIDLETGLISVDPKCVDIYIEDDYIENEAEKARYDYLKNNPLVKVTLERVQDTFSYKYLV